jgi:cytochrome P450 family 4
MLLVNPQYPFRISYIISTKFVKVWQRIDFLFRLTPSKKRLDKLLKISHDFTTDIIVKRRQALLENDEDYENEGIKKLEQSPK